MPAMPELTSDLIDAIQRLPAAYERLERALLGDASIGHKGLVDRTERLETLADNIGTVHEAMEDRRKEGDARAHGRIDALSKETVAEIAAVREEGRTVARKLDRVIWMFAGAAFTAGGGLAFLIQQLLRFE